MEMTREIAWAAAWNAANASMRKAGRAAWSEDDYAAACETFNRLWPEEAEIAAAHADYQERLKLTAKALDIAEYAAGCAYPGMTFAEVIPDRAWRHLCSKKRIAPEHRAYVRRVAELHFTERRTQLERAAA